MNGHTLADIIDIAIEEEEKAFKLYTENADKVSDQQASEMLTDIASMEKGHAQKLKNLRENKIESAAFDAKEFQDSHITDSAAEIKLNENSSFADVLTFAIAAEQKAYELYSTLCHVFSREEDIELLKSLANEELKHKNLLQKYYDEKVLNKN